MNRNLLEELVSYVPDSDKIDVVQRRADNVINSAINLMDFITESFTEEEAADLRKRLISSIKNKDHKRFDRGVLTLYEKKGKKDGKTK